MYDQCTPLPTPDGYAAFLASKTLTVQPSGIDVAPDAIHPSRFPFQADTIRWQLRKGRAACFAATGLGKAGMALEACRLTGERSLIVTPLGVVSQFVAEAARLDQAVTVLRDASDVRDGVNVVNYDRLHLIDPSAFGCVALDESSVLKDADAKTRTRVIEMFSDTPYRFAYSATPAPNDVAELANHAEFLGVMSRVEMLATWFVHDDTGWRLKGHAREPFYRWLASWAISLKRPSNLGYSDDGYILPPLQMHSEIVQTDYVPEGQLFSLGLKGITDRANVRKATVADRVARAVEIVNREPDEPWIVWCGLNAEQDAVAAALGGRCISVHGSMTPEAKVDGEARWRSGAAPVLASKVAIFGQGMNWQHCARMVFVGLSDSFEAYHQAIRRCWRFGQARPVHVYIVLTDVEQPIYANVLRKEREFEEMTDALVRHVAEYERAELGQARQRVVSDHTQPMALPSWLGGAA